MKIFSRLYQRVMSWSRHRHAPYYLSTMSFVESSVFPIPPDVMLAPMALAKPQSAWLYATLATVFSTLGGILGYIIGAYAFHLVHPLIVQFGYEPMYLQITTWFKDWGFWIIFLAGFTPIPYKLFTIASGVAQLALLPFILGSIVGRGGRFFLVAGLMRWGGERMEKLLMHYIDRITWFVLGITALIAIIWHLFKH